MIPSFVVLAFAASFVSAFTNGTLLPSYLCADAAGGLPTSLGGVLKYLVKEDAQQKIAGYHNQNSTMAQTGVVTTQSTMTTIAPGAAVPLTVHTAGLDPNAALIGLLIYAVDDQGQKLGTFSQMSASMKAFPGCSPPGSTDIVGLVHGQTLDEGKPDGQTNVEGGIVWNAPVVLMTTTVTFKGLAVTDTGFGYHNTVFQVTGNMPRPAAGSYMPNSPAPNRVFKCFPKGQVPPTLMGMMVTGGTTVVVPPAANKPMPPMAGMHF